ncbi:hypothetical protein dsx2_1284 [Desulfovibrio sp. X2]|uniref:hypothetical protein n=1 Tax=Desulfovibrio sp. X2 TaxID=941449 RepID=UPI00035878A7|nr:hypothetical protein [Desulfovibrio sp. X2]EPR44656.1 hypothetical protein dsx2_1284 [Desulfovibrio sp. X2]
MKRLAAALLLLFLLLGAVWWGLRYASENAARREMQTLAARISTHARLTWQGLSVNLLQRSVILYDVRVAVPSEDPVVVFTAEKAYIRRPGENHFYVDLVGIAPEPDEAARLSGLLGCAPGDLRAAAAVDAVWDPLTSGLTLKSLELSAPALCTLHLSGTLLNLPPPDSIGPTLSVQAVFIQLKRLTATYVDHSLADRLLAREARRLGADPLAYRRALAGIIDRDIQDWTGKATTPEDKIVLANASQAVRTFLERPGTLSLQLAPDKPASLVEILLFPPLESARRLNLRLSAQEGPPKPAAVPPAPAAEPGTPAPPKAPAPSTAPAAPPPPAPAAPPPPAPSAAKPAPSAKPPASAPGGTSAPARPE